MAKEQEKPYKGAVVVTAYGNDINEIKAAARQQAGLPFGIVTPAYGGDAINIHEERDGKGNRKTGRQYAMVKVTPSQQVNCSCHPTPVEGVGYYTLDELEKALRDLNYVSTESIVAKARKQLSFRDDGRYGLDELKRSVVDMQGGCGLGGMDSGTFLEKVALQARKNRVFDAHAVA